MRRHHPALLTVPGRPRPRRGRRTCRAAWHRRRACGSPRCRADGRAARAAVDGQVDRHPVGVALPGGRAADGQVGGEAHAVQVEDRGAVAGVAPVPAAQPDGVAGVVVPPRSTRSATVAAAAGATRRASSEPRPPRRPDVPQVSREDAHRAHRGDRRGAAVARPVGRRTHEAAQDPDGAVVGVADGGRRGSCWRPGSARERGNWRATIAPSAGVVIESSSPLSTSVGTRG